MGIYDELSKLSGQSPTPKVTHVPKEQEEKEPQSTDARTQAHKHAPARAPADLSMHARICEYVWKAVIHRRRLGGFTFRYRTEELDRLDETVAEINKDQEAKVSKNDVVRIALNWLLEDYSQNKHVSVLSLVLKRLRV